MSIADCAIGQIAIAEQGSAKRSGGKPPRNRLVTAKADQIQMPEPR